MPSFPCCTSRCHRAFFQVCVTAIVESKGTTQGQSNKGCNGTATTIAKKKAPSRYLPAQLRNQALLTSIRGRCFDLTSQATWRTTRWLPVLTRLRIATRCVPTQAPGVRLPIPVLLPPLQPLSISRQPTGVGQPDWDREKLFLPVRESLDCGLLATWLTSGTS